MGASYGGNANSYWKTYIEWSVNQNYSDTQVSVTVTLYMYFMKRWSDGCDTTYNSTSYVYVNGQTAGIYRDWNHAPSAGQYIWLGSATFYVNKGHGNTYLDIRGYLGRTAGFTSIRGSSTAYGSDSANPKTNYAVVYDANGGEGTIANSTKWYGENLTLSDGIGFTKAHSTLVGWNTSADGSGTHYDLGGTYSANAGVTLYAEWKLNAVENQVKVNDSWKNGIYYYKVNDIIVIPHTGYAKINDVWVRMTSLGE